MMQKSKLSDIDFQEIALVDLLMVLTTAEIDQLHFGVIGFDADERVQIYNSQEAKLAGMDKVSVIGGRMFEVVAPCMNNYIVADRFKEARVHQTELDITLEYVLTLRMRPTPCTMRLLSKAGSPIQFILISRT